jgi:CDP-diacylglycerol--glycerol-3-phosphate 3-phosphatidyltransferase
MVSIYDLKPKFQALLRPLVERLARAGITANQVTLAAVVLSLLQGAWMAWQPWTAAPLLALPVVLFVRMALNAIDGMLAREHGQRSRLGAMLNELGDAVSDAALYLPLAWVPGLNVPLIELIVVLAVMSELAGVLGQTIGASRRYDGPMGKSDRAFWLGALALALGLGLAPGRWLDGVLGLIVVLLVVTIVNRVRRALAEAA